MSQHPYIARLLILLLAILLALPVSAEASSRQAHRSHAAGANPAVVVLAVAERYWGGVPCGARITVQVNRALPAGMDAATDGWVTFNSSLGANDLQAPATTYSQCVIGLAHWRWPNASAMRQDWNMLCLTVIHELGHLLGHPHSLAPASVMAPVFTSEANVPAICKASRV